MHHNPVVHIVDIIAFAAIENLNVLIRSCHLCLGGSLHGVREGLGNTVVGDGNGLMPPGGSLFHGSCRLRQGIHVTHGGMQVQFHPLFPGGEILPLGEAARHHGIGLEHHVVFKSVFNQLSLHPQDGANLHIFNNRLCLLGFQESTDPDGIGIVRHIELHHISIALGQLLMVNGKDPALHDDGAHVHGHILHGHAGAPEWLSIESGTVRRLHPGGRCLLSGLHQRVTFNLPLLHGLNGIEQSLALQRAACLHGDGHRGGKSLPQGLLHLGNQRLYGILAIGTKLDGQLFPLPFPGSTGQRSTGDGVAVDKEHHQLLGLDFMQLGCRVGDGDADISKAVQQCHVPLHGFQQLLGNIVLAMGSHMDGTTFRMNVRCHNGRLGKSLGNFIRRRIVGKHIQ